MIDHIEIMRKAALADAKYMDDMVFDTLTDKSPEEQILSKRSTLSKRSVPPAPEDTNSQQSNTEEGMGQGICFTPSSVDLTNLDKLKDIIETIHKDPEAMKQARDLINGVGEDE